MTPELTVLALAGLLQGLQLAAYSIAANLQVGPKVTTGPRDNAPQLTGTAGRLQRVVGNHFEGLILFTIAVLVVTLGQEASRFTAICAWIYLAARLIYVPAYVFGWVPWRSAIWGVGLAATLLMIIAAIL